MTTIIAAGPSEFLDLAFWTINNKVAATGKCYFGIIERVERAEADVNEKVREAIQIVVRDRVSLHDAVVIANMTLDRIADINGLQAMRAEVTFVDDTCVSKRAG